MRQAGVIQSLLLLGFMTCVCSAAQAGEKDAKYYQKQFDHWSRVIAQLKEADVTEKALQDIEVIRTWISQAQAFLATDKLEEIEPVLRRIEAQAEYVRAKVNRFGAEDAAAEAEQLAQTAEAEANQITETADAAEKKMKELEAQGL